MYSSFCFRALPPELTSEFFLFQGDRGETGPPGPAGFAGPPVSKHNNTDQLLSLLESEEHDSRAID